MCGIITAIESTECKPVGVGMVIYGEYPGDNDPLKFRADLLHALYFETGHGHRVGLSYSRMISGLIKAEVAIDRKNLAELAVKDPLGFTKLANMAKEQMA